MDLWNMLTDGFMPHGYCLRWDVPLLFVFIAGNVGIALAYFIIPAALRHFIGKRKDLPYPHMFRLFAAFILSCGVTHLAKVWTLYQPAYWVEAVIDLWTAGVSLITALLLVPLIPQALKLRSPMELAEANIQLQKLAEELKAANEELVRTSGAKDVFLATMSHELRTPLNSILGFNDVMLMGLSGPLTETQKKQAGYIKQSAKHLLALINDILDLAKVESGKMELDAVPIRLWDVAADVCKGLEPLAQERHLYLNVLDSDAAHVDILGDGRALRQILTNLISNAIKFTDQGGVSVSFHSDQNYVRLAVEDTGIGISEEDAGKLFKGFVQLARNERKQEGTGLGLALSKRLAELMGGDIQVKSELGKGSTFTVVFPVARGKE